MEEGLLGAETSCFIEQVYCVIHARESLPLFHTYPDVVVNLYSIMIWLCALSFHGTSVLALIYRVQQCVCNNESLFQENMIT